MDKLLPAGLFVLILLLSGCATNRIGDFTVLSTRLVDLSHIPPEKLKGGTRVRGEDMHFGSFPNVKSAIDNALDKGHGDIMVDAVLYHRVAVFAQGYVVEGRVINSQE
jgi:hypothetical protein